MYTLKLYFMHPKQENTQIKHKQKQSLKYKNES